MGQAQTDELLVQKARERLAVALDRLQVGLFPLGLPSVAICTDSPIDYEAIHNPRTGG